MKVEKTYSRRVSDRILRINSMEEEISFIHSVHICVFINDFKMIHHLD